MKSTLRSLCVTSAVCSLTVFSLLLTGCGIGTAAAPAGTQINSLSGVAHGGPTPIANGSVTLYATTSNGYGATATVLGGPVTTASDGSFTVVPTSPCPAGQYAYLVLNGGNTGANANNPNSVLMAPVGACSAMYTGTTYIGGNYIVINELTTIASAYALNNFMSVTGTALTGYTVNIGAPATNNGTSGCVNNAYYGTVACPTTVAAGLKHAFANAALLVNTSGTANTTTTNGAIVPAQFLNSLANAVESCVNSVGGGTNGSGTPNSTISGTGTGHDGTICGKLFAFTSYTVDGTTTGTLVSAGNTLSALANLAHRPSGSPTTSNACASNTSGSGSTTAATCIFNLAASNNYYGNPAAMTAAPVDWMLGISYPKGSFNSIANSTVCGAVTPPTLGVYYPYAVATDINDNITILNEESSSGACYNLLTIASDGTPIGSNAFDNSSAAALWVSTDAAGHAIVPVKAGTNNGIQIFKAGAADSTIAVTTSLTSASFTGAGTPYYVSVDGNDDLYITARNGTANTSYAVVTSDTHTAPTYTGTNTGATSSMNQNFIDVANNAVSMTSSGSGTGRVYGVAPGATTFTQTANVGGSTSHNALGTAIGADTNNYAYIALPNAAAPTATVVEKIQYTVSGTTWTWGTVPGVSTPTYSYSGTITNGPTNGDMDGNNVLWFAEFSNASISGATVTSGHLRMYDTVNNYGSPAWQGCKLTPGESVTSIALNSGGSGYTPATGTFAVSFTGGNGTGAAATATTTGGVVTGLTMTSYGNSYTSVPTPVFTVGAGTGATATPSLAYPTACGSQEPTSGTSAPYLAYQTRGTAIDAAGDVWLANGSQGQINEIIGIAAPTWPRSVHRGTAYGTTMTTFKP